MLRRSTTGITILSFLILLAQPVQTYAGWDDSQIKQIMDNVQDILDTINNARATIADGKIKTMIGDARAMLQQAVDEQQDGLPAFLDGGCDVGNLSSECGRFRADLKDFVQGVQDLNNEMLAFHDVPGLDIQMQDPGLQKFLDEVPGDALFPAYKVMTKLGIFNSGLLQAINDARANLATLKPVVYDESQPMATAQSTSGTIPVPASCGFVLDHQDGIKTASYSIVGIGVVTRIVGAILEGMSKTIFAGPVEMDGGIHGYVHGTIKQNTPHMVGAIFNGVGHVSLSIGQYALGKVKFCRVEQRQENLRLNQETILSNQDEILLGQQEILCAFKHNLPDQCAQFVGNGFGNRGIKRQGGSNGRR